MKNLSRNTKEVYISYYKGKQKQLLGNKSVEVDVWDLPFNETLTVSVPTGNYITEMFGTVDSYDLICTTTNIALRVDDKTKFWVNLIPNVEGTNNDYVVKNIKLSLNYLIIGLSRKINNMQDIWLLNSEETQPTKIRLNIHNENEILTITVDKRNNVLIDANSKVWFQKDYNELQDDFNYVLVETYESNNSIIYILESTNNNNGSI